MTEATLPTKPTRPAAKAALWVGYCVLVSAVVLVWVARDDALEGPALVALGCIILLSIVLGRLLPGWGFAAPVVLALAWLLVVIETTPGRDAGAEPSARGLALIFLLIAVLAAEAGVFLGSMGAVWAWTREP